MKHTFYVKFKGKFQVRHTDQTYGHVTVNSSAFKNLSTAEVIQRLKTYDGMNNGQEFLTYSGIH
jgi:hypothetical protein